MILVLLSGKRIRTSEVLVLVLALALVLVPAPVLVLVLVLALTGSCSVGLLAHGQRRYRTRSSTSLARTNTGFYNVLDMC